MKFKKIITLSTVFLLTVGMAEILRQKLKTRYLSGDIKITLENALWKQTEENLNYQDITLDLVCQKSQCETEIWGFSPKFNRADHDGIVNLIKKDNSWELQVLMLGVTGVEERGELRVWQHWRFGLNRKSFFLNPLM